MSRTMLSPVATQGRGGSRADRPPSAGAIRTARLITTASALAVLCGLAVVPSIAAAQTPDADANSSASQDKIVEQVVITGARNLTGVLQKRDGSVALGFDKPLVETPRSVTAISDLLLDRYNIKTVYDFTAVAAGTYTGSYFGVPGSLNVRGTIADNYFNGFQMVTNYATYPTPVDASSSVDIVRGPPAPYFGAGQVGGYLNFIPKSAKGDGAKYLEKPTGAMSFTYGSYNQKEGTIEGGAPLTLGGKAAGLYGFLEIIDSDSFYLREHPKSQTAQVTFSTDLPDNWSFSTTAQYIHSDGYDKDIGWNRVTQNLIDHDQYQAGMALTPIVQPGQSYITTADYNAAVAKSGPIQQYVLPVFGLTAVPNQYTELNPATAKLVTLSPRDTDISNSDINRATTPLIYFGLTHTYGDTGTLKLESYTQYLDALNYQSYGFGTQFRTSVNEERLTYDDKRNFGDNIFAQTIVGASFRYSKAYSATYLLSEAGVQDRWDLSQPQTSDEIFNNVFDSSTHGMEWDNAITSTEYDYSAFLMEDLLLFKHLDVTGGVRYDNYTLSDKDTGPCANANGANYGTVTIATPTACGTNQLPIPTTYSEHAGPTSYNISVSYKNPYVIPYYTYAEAYSLNLDQGGAIEPAQLYGDSAVGKSMLSEAGLKTSQFGGRLYASADVYRQQNQYLDSRDHTVNTQFANGFEAELRYLVTKELGITGTYTVQHIVEDDGGSGQFVVITPQEAGITGLQGYGGQYETNTEFLGLGNKLSIHTSPAVSASLFATYDYHGIWGLTGGATYNSTTGGDLPGSIKLPAYTLVKAGAYLMFHGVRADLYVDNLLDKQYFIAEYDVDANATVLPGVGREIHFKLSKKF